MPNTRMARRVKFHDARRHFESGGTVLVSEYGGEPFRVVTSQTTTHSRDTTTWQSLAETVSMWRNRYPNQRFYIVEDAAPACPMFGNGTDNG
jgi:hypothetical protein